MDRERLKEVHQSDLTEGRINEDFVDWLKTKGTSWLLMVVIALFIYAAVIRWQNYRTNYQAEAWIELSKAVLPSNYEDVAEKYPDVGAVAQMARLRAAGRLLAAVQTGKTLAAETETASPLTDEIRKDYLEKADRLYAKIVESDDHSANMMLLVTSGLTGRAAIAESRGDLEAAKRFYAAVEKRSEGRFPEQAERARRAAATADDNTATVTFPTKEQMSIMQAKELKTPSLEPVWTDTWIDELLAPKPAETPK